MLTGVGYGTVSDYQDVPPGEYTVSMRPAGAAADTPPVLSTTVEVTGGSARTVAGVGLFAELGPGDHRRLAWRPRPRAGADPGARRRVATRRRSTSTTRRRHGGRHAAGVRHDQRLRRRPGGVHDLQVSAGGEPPTDLPVDLAPGAVYSLVVLDSAGSGLTVQPVLDAASPGVIPPGGVETGAGGTADQGLPSASPALGAGRSSCGAGALPLRVGRRAAPPRRAPPGDGPSGARHRRPAGTRPGGRAGSAVRVVRGDRSRPRLRWRSPCRAHRRPLRPPPRRRLRSRTAPGRSRWPAARTTRVEPHPSGCGSPRSAWTARCVRLGVDDAGALAAAGRLRPGRLVPGRPRPGRRRPGRDRRPRRLLRRAGRLLPAARARPPATRSLVDRTDGTTARFTVTAVAPLPEGRVPDRAGLRPTPRPSSG